MDIRDILNQAVDSSGNSIFTPEEFKALSYQLQGSYDNKPVEILSTDLYHQKTLGAATSLSFFDAAGTDLTISNVSNSQLPAGVSHTVHELLLRFTVIPTTQPNDLIAQIDACRLAIAKSHITVGVQNKTPWIDLHGSRLLAGFAGFQNLVEAAANTNSVVVGNATNVDLRYNLSIPKVIGEKVNFFGKIDFNVAVPAIIGTTNVVSVTMALGGIQVRPR
jgi:hypothetical protein